MWTEREAHAGVEQGEGEGLHSHTELAMSQGPPRCCPSLELLQ